MDLLFLLDRFIFLLVEGLFVTGKKLTVLGVCQIGDDSLAGTR